MSYIYNLTDTWNAGGTTFAGIKMAVTNTASSASSKLLDLSVSGATTASFAVDKSGNLSLNGSITGPLLIGGTGTTSALTLRTTSGVGTTGSDVIFQTGDNGASETMRVLNSGFVGIGTANPGARLHLKRTSQCFLITESSIQSGLIFNRANGTSGYTFGRSLLADDAQNFFIYDNVANATRLYINDAGEVCIAGYGDQGAYNLQCNGTGVWGAGAYVNGSDARLKESVKDIAGCLDIVKSLRPVTFKYKSDYSRDTNIQPGFIAQELQAAMAGQEYVDGVVQAGPEYLNVAYQTIIPVLTKAIQELAAEIAALKEQLNA